MAEAALASIAKSALQLFTSLAKDEFLLLWNSQKELKRLEATIGVISNIHQDTQQRGSNDVPVKHCLAKLRSVMYDAEDLFDGLAFQILHKRTTTGTAFTKEVRLFFSGGNQLGVIFKTAHAVKAIRESLDDIKNDMEYCGLIRQQPPLVQPFVRDKTHSFVHNEDVIGRDEDRDRIINMLLPQNEGEASDTRSLSVITIIGFGGLGKTTLAQYVYNNDGVKQGFDVRLWACINDLSDLEQVLIEIIASKEGRHPDLGLEKLQEKLRELISGRKFLLVLDDVWDKNPRNWLKLEPLLRCGETGSRVLVTTRSRKVVECLDTSKQNCCVNLAVLSDENAWSLFVQKAFYSKDELSKYPELEPLGKKIVHRCGNLPLAVIVVGSLLRGRGWNEKIWSDFLDNEFKVTISADGDENLESIKSVLMFSYNDLFPNLKLCFAYCSLFPKDHEFDKDVLVRSWLAQGFIRPFADNEQRLEKEGEEYFCQLVDRCFFQEVRNYKSAGTHKRTAKMHDLIHDMAIDVAKTENLMLDKVTEIKEEKEGLRHISIALDVEDSFDCHSLVSEPKTVRTLLLSRCNGQFSQSSFKLLVASFTMLRTLDLSRLGIDVIPESIGGLIHLRYLDLSWNRKLKHLPDSMCKLHHLMILVLKGCFLLGKLPRRIEKLARLRQLFIDGCDKLDCLPSGLTALTRLVNLDRLIVHCRDGGLRYLEGLDNLAETLKIELLEDGWFEAVEDAKKSNMAMKNKLNEMHIEWKQRYSATAKMGKEEAKAVLEALRPHENLEYLRIDNYGGEVLSSWFWRIKYVKQLYLYNCDNVEYLEDGKRGDLGLPSLKLLMIETMRNLKGWWRPENAQGTDRPHLSSVSSLFIQGCPQLKGEMPLFEGVENLLLVGVDAEVVQESLVPNGSSFSPFYNNNRLKELTLREIEGLIDLPEGWIKHLTALERLTIEKCSKLRRVSRRGLAHLTALKQLEIGSGEIGDGDDIEDDKMGIIEAGMPWKALQGLKYLKVKVGGKHLLEGLEYLTSLKQLKIGSDKIGYDDGDEDDKIGSVAGMPWKGLQGLQHLEVGVGDRNLLDGLQYLTSLEILRIHKWKDARLQVELSFKPLQNLGVLYIGFGKEIFDLPKSGIQHLHSLNRLTITDCKELYLCWKTLLNMKLVLLELERVERVIDDTMMVMEVEPHCRLDCLIIYDCAGVDDIPWIFLSSSLHTLLLGGMGERENLPDGIQHLSSLQSLDISGCEKVTSLPVWIPKLTSLVNHRSKEMKTRCERGTGEDWPLISHLPHIYITAARSDNELSEEEEEEEGEEGGGGGSRRMGCCLSRFKRRFTNK